MGNRVQTIGCSGFRGRFGAFLCELDRAVKGSCKDDFGDHPGNVRPMLDKPAPVQDLIRIPLIVCSPYIYTHIYICRYIPNWIAILCRPESCRSWDLGSSAVRIGASASENMYELYRVLL